MYDTIIIGGGASGLVAAIAAIRKNENVLVLEKMPQCGLKLRITGKGRCNLTNTLPLKEFLSHCGSEPRFLYPSFSKFFNNELISFFEDLGVELIVERGNRVFPKSGKAQDVFLALIRFLEENNCTILKNTRVNNLIIKGNKINGVETKAYGDVSKTNKAPTKNFFASKVILACGGESYPNTGSDGDGIRLAKIAGHKVEETFPSLVGLRLLGYNANSINPKLINFETKNVGAVVKDAKGRIIAKEFGDIIFREDYIDGPIILTISRQVASKIGMEKLVLELDLKPAIDTISLDKRFQTELNQRGRETIESSLRAFLPLEIIYLLKSKARLDFSKPSSQINKEERKKIIGLMKNMSFEIEDSMGFQRAVVTQGGVSLKEVNPKTLQSKLIEGLYFCGEVLDLDADTGGFNLQIAFSTGFLAGS
ncbi:MAG: NAD(P)/FAD-dependent oxidoreductase [Bacteroidales bacterium]|jgi:predicted Rossmann fold flavoprotein|nr:NAD(P)/FAD-dependent oxidoreductase [Bacteroidales bacterium]MDD4703311.1 NAD(P)/FAD-dependent oxidoreductase [Bacteroidales bacterium]MDX9798344.1 NAD(P)/FAD-dependent oxidoreductase [Bacteroidales bacterium]